MQRRRSRPPTFLIMETHKLGTTGLNVSRVCCGTMTFGAQTDESTADAMVGLCLDRGINFFDTANVYNHGMAETILGNALRGRRDRVVLASKIAGQMGPASDQSGLARAAVVREVEASLRRLQTDYLDLCYLHWPDYAVPVEETLEAMSQLVRAGKVRHVGTSNYASWQICRMLGLAERDGWPVVGVTQPMYTSGILPQFIVTTTFDL